MQAHIAPRSSTSWDMLHLRPTPPPVFLTMQVPNDVLWVLDSRHDMYCGIFDATGDKFFSASQDGIVRIFDYTGRYFRLKREIICHDFVNLVNLDDETSQIRVFHLANDMGANDIFSLSFCGVDSTKLICGRNRGRLTLCNLETGTCEELDASPRPGADINAVATLDDSGDTFVAGGDDTCIRMFDARALNEGCLASFPGHVDGITYIDSKVRLSGYFEFPLHRSLICCETFGGFLCYPAYRSLSVYFDGVWDEFNSIILPHSRINLHKIECVYDCGKILLPYIYKDTLHIPLGY
ncbi:unnamed protein product [Schistocephalus solidus]|uniref:WD_REPEATS_REGION domain-containing protein n=1 Tax=Schistocephalus solidus TaxID=70667 RepID=A0A183TEU6_SCHSO|nr:unnamed protein product [Schistocephalus solidus]